MKTATLKVGTRLSIGFGLVLAMMAIMVVIALVRFADIDNLNNKIIEKDWVKADAANTIDVMTRENARQTMELLITTDAAHVAKIHKLIDANKATIDEAIKTLESLVYMQDGKDLLVKIREARSRYVTSFSKVAKLVAEDRRDEAISLMNTETLPALDALEAHIAAMTELQNEIVVASSAEVKDHVHTAYALMLVLCGFALCAGIIAALLITRTLLKQLGGEPDYASAIAGSIAAGDLTVAIDVKPNDRASMLAAMRAMRDSLVNIVGQVRAGTDTIATASTQIATGNLDLSSRTEEQASALEETASSMEELTGTVKQNTDNARQADQLAKSASEVAMKGGAVVSEVVDTMGSINESSKKIVDIIGVIDGIAFQTNILALNAAVEAARAGEQGRGFAVVASEVRNLAQRSAAAAKEIKTLIGDSVEKVAVGARLVDQAGATMDEVVASVKRVTDIIGEITSAGNEQSSGIEQINQAIMQMDNVTQQNAALVEEAAAAAQSMQEQSMNLLQVVSVFKLAEGSAPPALAKAASRIAPKPAAKPLRNTSPARKLSVAKAAAPATSRASAKTEEWEEF